MATCTMVISRCREVRRDDEERAKGTDIREGKMLRWREGSIKRTRRVGTGEK